MNLIYVGDIYDITSTMGSEVYHEDGQRSDWGKIKLALRDGEEIHIRQATKLERLAQYEYWAAHIEETAKRDHGWLYGTGNYTTPPVDIVDRVRVVKEALAERLGLL